MQTVIAKKHDEHLAERWIDHSLVLVLVHLSTKHQLKLVSLFLRQEVASAPATQNLEPSEAILD